MEHKLIQGGESFLPFARSRIKALRATGLKYASQKFEIDGVSIRVRIAGEHEYIELEGSSVKILSGAIKVGEIVELPVPPEAPPGTSPQKVLRSYKPTQNAWDYPLNKNPAKPVASFNDEKFLAKQKASWLHAGQYADLFPTMFSGLMAKAVAIIMARGLEVKYSYSWDKCHGIVLDEAGKPWLVEISAENGVIAKRLPVDKFGRGSKVDAEVKANELFGGIPNGGAFPLGGKLATAINAGSVIQLLSAQDMSDYFDCVPHAAHIGWTFGVQSKAAYNAVVRIGETTAGVCSGKLFRLDFSIGEQVKTATLVTVEQGDLTKSSYDDFGSAQGAPLFFQHPGNGVSNLIARTIGFSEPVLDNGAPIFVCHINDELEIIRSSWFDAGGGNFTIFKTGNTHEIAASGRPYRQASAQYEERKVYPCRSAIGQKVVAYSSVLRQAWDFFIVAVIPSPSGSVDPDSGTAQVSTTYRFRRYSDYEIISEKILHSYAERDSLVVMETAPTSSFIKHFESYDTAPSYNSELEISGLGPGGVTFQPPYTDNIIGTAEYITGAYLGSGGQAGQTLLNTAFGNIYLFDDHIPERRKIYWSTGDVSTVYDPDPYDPLAAGDTQEIDKYMTSPVLVKTPGVKEFVYAGFKSMILVGALALESPLPRVRYNFIGCN